MRRHLAGKEQFPAWPDEFDLEPTQIHAWVKQVLDQAAAAFRKARTGRRALDTKDQKIAVLPNILAMHDAWAGPAFVMPPHKAKKDDEAEPGDTGQAGAASAGGTGASAAGGGGGG